MKKILFALFTAILAFSMIACNSNPKTTYTVVFDSNGGSYVPTQTVSEGGKAVKPADPTKSNSIYFNGWTTDSSASSTSTDFDFNTPITEDITLYAKWTSYIKFTQESGSVTIGRDIYGDPEKVPEVFLQYSYDGKSWSDFTTATEVTVNSTNKAAYFQAKDGKINKKFGDWDKWTNNHFTTTSTDNGKVSLSGNIMSLLDNTGNQTEFTEKAVFMGLFGDFNYWESSYCPNITDASNLILPAKELTVGCYYGMFCLCTDLTKAPALPAEELAKRCYYYMFYDCTGLTNVPALPATTLAEDCYNGMFEGCTGLTNAPELPATTLAEDCYNGMFDGCTSLINAPALPATTLEDGCYESMFCDCISLKTAPKLPATSLTDRCYCSMFYGCTGLTNAPALPATTLTDCCYYSMFYGCSRLKVTTTTDDATWFFKCPSTAGLDYPVEDMFAGTDGSFKGTPTSGTDYYWY